MSYDKFPKILQASKALTTAQKLIINKAIDRQNDKSRNTLFEKCLSVSYLSNALNLGESTIKRAMRELKKYSFFKTQQLCVGGANILIVDECALDEFLAPETHTNPEPTKAEASHDLSQPLTADMQPEGWVKMNQGVGQNDPQVRHKTNYKTTTTKQTQQKPKRECLETLMQNAQAGKIPEQHKQIIDSENAKPNRRDNPLNALGLYVKFIKYNLKRHTTLCADKCKEYLASFAGLEKPPAQPTRKPARPRQRVVRESQLSAFERKAAATLAWFEAQKANLTERLELVRNYLHQEGVAVPCYANGDIQTYIERLEYLGREHLNTNYSQQGLLTA